MDVVLLHVTVEELANIMSHDVQSERSKSLTIFALVVKGVI